VRKGDSVKDSTLTPLVPPMLHLCEVGDPSPPSTDAVPDDIDRIPVIYLAGPYSGEDPWEVEQNVRRAEYVAYELEALGACVVCPHTNTRFQDRRTPYKQKIRTTLAAMRRCDAVYMLPSWHLSSGARGEHDEAKRRGMVQLYDLASAGTYITARVGGKR
jgi:hypothetical protein